jgi:hypothetical protein
VPLAIIDAPMFREHDGRRSVLAKPIESPRIEGKGRGDPRLLRLRNEGPRITGCRRVLRLESVAATQHRANGARPDSAALGVTTPAALGPRTSDVTLPSGMSFSDGGNTLMLHGQLSLVLRRRRITQQAVTEPAG